MPSMQESAPPDTPVRNAPDSDAVTPDISNSEGKPPLLQDVMQLSRLGEIEPLRRLFDEGEIGPSYKDAEGITPLHVCQASASSTISSNFICSGQLSTITMLCANFLSKREQMSMPKVVRLSLLQPCGQLSAVTTMS